MIALVDKVILSLSKYKRKGLPTCFDKLSMTSDFEIVNI